jgi:hypothetical protein
MTQTAVVVSMSNKLQEYEQEAYREIRDVLSQSFLERPDAFVRHFGCRPEDLSGAQLREYYHAHLAQGIPLTSTDQAFCRRFLEGRIFP